MLQLFKDARAGLPLSPGARAFLKLLGGVGLCAVVALATVLSTSNHLPDWHVLLGAFAVTCLASLSKYWKAHGDPVLGGLAGQAADAVAQVAGVPNDLKQELQDVVAPPADPAANPADAMAMVRSDS